MTKLSQRLKAVQTQITDTAKINHRDNINVICSDGVSAFRNAGISNNVIFNPPYLPEDPAIDKYTPKYELQQLVGGQYGYEMLNHIITQLNSNTMRIELFCKLWDKSIPLIFCRRDDLSVTIVPNR